MGDTFPIKLGFVFQVMYGDCAGDQSALKSLMQHVLSKREALGYKQNEYYTRILSQKVNFVPLESVVKTGEDGKHVRHIMF